MLWEQPKLLHVILSYLYQDSLEVMCVIMLIWNNTLQCNWCLLLSISHSTDLCKYLHRYVLPIWIQLLIGYHLHLFKWTYFVTGSRGCFCGGTGLLLGLPPPADHDRDASAVMSSSYSFGAQPRDTDQLPPQRSAAWPPVLKAWLAILGRQ